MTNLFFHTFTHYDADVQQGRCSPSLKCKFAKRRLLVFSRDGAPKWRDHRSPWDSSPEDNNRLYKRTGSDLFNCFYVSGNESKGQRLPSVDTCRKCGLKKN